MKLTQSSFEAVSRRMRPLDVIIYGRDGRPVTSGVVVATKLLIHGRPQAGTLIQIAELIHRGQGWLETNLALPERMAQFDQAWWLPLASKVRENLDVSAGLQSVFNNYGRATPPEPRGFWKQLVDWPLEYRFEDGSELTRHALVLAGLKEGGDNVEQLLQNNFFRQDYYQISGDPAELPFDVTEEEIAEASAEEVV